MRARGSRLKGGPLLSVAVLAMTMAVLVPLPASADGCDPEFVGKTGRTWIVHPTGGDDTANIQCALDAAAAAGPGAAVRLTAGDFHAGLLTPTGLQGSFSGAGPDATTVSALPDLDCQGRIDIGTGATWIYFAEGDIHLSNMTLEVTDPTPCAPWNGPWDDPADEPRTFLFGGIVQFAGPGTGAPGYDCDDPDVHEIDSKVTDMVFRGPAYDIEEEDPEVLKGVWVAGTSAVQCPQGLSQPISGHHNVWRSHFENVRAGVEATNLTDGSLTVGGGAGNGNSFAGTVFGVVAFDLNGSRMVVAHNEIHEVFGVGVGVVQGVGAFSGYPAPGPSDLDVEHNSIIAGAEADGVGIIDFVAAFLTGDKTVDAKILRNDIHVDDSLFGGVFGFGAHDAQVTNNTFTGAGGFAAVYHGVDGEPSGGWSIVGNDVTGFDGGIADIWLGSGSFNDRVVTVDAGDVVLDEGADNVVLGPGSNSGSGSGGPTAQMPVPQMLDRFNRHER